MKDPSNLGVLADCYERIVARDIDWDSTDKVFWLKLRQETLDVRGELRHGLKRARAEVRNRGAHAPRDAYLRATEAFDASGAFEQRICQALGRAKSSGRAEHTAAFEACFLDVCREALDLRLFAELVTVAQTRSKARLAQLDAQDGEA